MDLVIDKLTRGVELGARLAVDVEDVAALNNGASVDLCGNVTVGDGGFAKTSDEAEFTNRGLGGDAWWRLRQSLVGQFGKFNVLGGHVDRRIIVTSDVVLGQRASGTSDLEVVVCVSGPHPVARRADT